MKLRFGLIIRFPDCTIYKEYMNENLAKRIKAARSSGTWRYVADAISYDYPDLPINPGNQIDGMALCESAAAYLGEDNSSNDWN